MRAKQTNNTGFFQSVKTLSHSIREYKKPSLLSSIESLAVTIKIGSI